jgi:very-short-patch-repair endonuclease
MTGARPIFDLVQSSSSWQQYDVHLELVPEDLRSQGDLDKVAHWINDMRLHATAQLIFDTHYNDQVAPDDAMGDSIAEKKFSEAVKHLAPGIYTALVAQHQVMINNQKYRIDFAIPNLMIAIEIDGMRAHSTQSAFINDRQRQRQLTSAGWRVIRFAAKEVLNRARVNACVDELRVMIGDDVTKLTRYVKIDKITETINKLDELDVPPGASIRVTRSAVSAAGYAVSQIVLTTAQMQRRTQMKISENE